MALLMLAILSLNSQALESRRFLFFLTFLLKMAVSSRSQAVTDYPPPAKQIFPPQTLSSPGSLGKWTGTPGDSAKRGVRIREQGPRGKTDIRKQPEPVSPSHLFLLHTPGMSLLPSLIC